MKGFTIVLGLMVAFFGIYEAEGAINCVQVYEHFLKECEEQNDKISENFLPVLAAQPRFARAINCYGLAEEKQKECGAQNEKIAEAMKEVEVLPLLESEEAEDKGDDFIPVLFPEEEESASEEAELPVEVTGENSRKGFEYENTYLKAE